MARFTEDSEITFGMFKGKLAKDVPAWYWVKLWDKGSKSFFRCNRQMSQYLIENIARFRTEAEKGRD